MSRSVFDGKLKKAYKTRVKHTILDLGHALLTHHEATRIHKPHQCHPEGSREHLGASCGPSGNHLEVLWELRDTSSELSGNHLGVSWKLSGDSWEPPSFSKNIFQENDTTTSSNFTMQPQDFFTVQPGLAECAKPLE